MFSVPLNSQKVIAALDIFFLIGDPVMLNSVRSCIAWNIACRAKRFEKQQNLAIIENYIYFEPLALPKAYLRPRLFLYMCRTLTSNISLSPCMRYWIKIQGVRNGMLFVMQKCLMLNLLVQFNVSFSYLFWLAKWMWDKYYKVLHSFSKPKQLNFKSHFGFTNFQKSSLI